MLAFCWLPVSQPSAKATVRLSAVFAVCELTEPEPLRGEAPLEAAHANRHAHEVQLSH